MEISKLGVLEGAVLLFGGPFSNLQATQAMRQEAARRGITPENCICTGDVVAYCADAAATVAEIRDWGCVVVTGNCEKQLAEGANECGCGFEGGSACDLLSAGWYGHANQEIGPQDRAWMGNLPDLAHFSHEGRVAFVCHGAVSDISRFFFGQPHPTSNFRARLVSLRPGTGARTHRLSFPAIAELRLHDSLTGHYGSMPGRLACRRMMAGLQPDLQFSIKAGLAFIPCRMIGAPPNPRCRPRG